MDNKILQREYGKEMMNQTLIQTLIMTLLIISPLGLFGGFVIYKLFRINKDYFETIKDMQIRLASKSTEEYIQMKNLEINSDEKLRELINENKLLQTKLDDFNKDRYSE
ncbi:MAG TPA: hypothetical protein PKY81_15340 [bacterium]|nr:hypothetical protein [bacterium]